ncbi:MAG: hypothetical protein K2H79_07400 [Bacteroidaceae bacterium]|nr:hypothetical protein [Bacteroidaceae bacterium]
METIETLIPDNEGNHLVVVLYFYDDEDKEASFHIPSDFTNIEIVDINIRKLDLEHPFYRDQHASIIHFVTSHLNEKYND